MKLKKKNMDHDHSNKHITTQEFDKFNAQIFAARLTYFKENKTCTCWKQIWKITNIWFKYFHQSKLIAQLWSTTLPWHLFQMIYYTLKRLEDTEKNVSWRFKGLSVEKFMTPNTTDNSLSPSIKWYGNLNICLVFKGSWLK